MVQYTIPNYFRAVKNIVTRNVKNLNRAGLLNAENAAVIAAARALTRLNKIDAARGIDFAGDPGGAGYPLRYIRKRRRVIRRRYTRTRPRRTFRRKIKRGRRRYRR